jgi:TPR repeat protein
MNLFDKACRNGHQVGCYHYGALLYLSSPGNKKDMDKSMNVLEKACTNGGNPESCYFAGGHHINTDNPSRDPVKALNLFKISCANNHAPSCFNIAVMHNKGDIGIPVDQAVFKEYKDKTEELVKVYGGRIGGTKTA